MRMWSNVLSEHQRLIDYRNMWPRHTHISQVWHLGLNAQQLIYTRYMISIWREYLYRYVFDALTFSFAHVHISTYLDTCKFYKCVYCIYVYVQIFSHTYIYMQVLLYLETNHAYIFTYPHIYAYISCIFCNIRIDICAHDILHHYYI